MIGNLKGIVFVAALAGASYALASGYGPAPYYSPATGAPASQQGMNAQNIAQDANQAVENTSMAKSKESALIQAQD
ncbi:hypothetical protein AWB79_06446 [Caballeronia hypogeia]|uniref:Lipoprotein n=1 Tax=Caballeronia hypogeia TaxID=1777140 RepID=A0A158D5W7_9BURK|nr:hypothetical protein [Caballeronia hypogeia]SAK89606.1 hypothetical protein AWB79_06446 [Caballeronia hypogeia]